MIELRDEADGTVSVVNGRKVLSKGHDSAFAALETVRDHDDLHPHLHHLVGRVEQAPDISTLHHDDGGPPPAEERTRLI